jgi:hypothetical protein
MIPLRITRARKGMFGFRNEKEREAFTVKLADFAGPHAVCHCGHTGSGPGDHSTIFAEGHGHCTVNGCSCPRFTFEEYLPDYIVAIIKARWAAGAELSLAQRKLLATFGITDTVAAANLRAHGKLA